MKSQVQFRRIRDAFFPRWRRGGDWRLSLHDDLDGADGRCDIEAKRIRVVRCNRSSDEVDVVLVHEICHAVASAVHGSKWQRRMLKAAHDAERLSIPGVGTMLRREVEGYRDAGRTTSGAVYDSIVQAAHDLPDVRFSDVIHFVRKDYGLPLAEFLDCYPRSKRVFDEARRDFGRHEIARAKLASRINPGPPESSLSAPAYNHRSDGDGDKPKTMGERIACPKGDA